MTDKVIWKKRLPTYATREHLPIDWKPVHVGCQGNDICLWYETKGRGIPLGTFVVIVVATGDMLDTQALQHIGTAVMPDLSVWHVYMELRI